MHRINLSCASCSTLPHKEKVQPRATDKEEQCFSNIAPLASVPGTLVAHATLSVSHLQDLDEQIAALTKACVDYFGVEPAFSLRIEVHPKLSATVEHVEKVNRILEEVSPELKLG